MLPQFKTIENFVFEKLNDVVDYRKELRLDPNKSNRGDPSHAEIVTRFNRYELSFQSCYLTPPEGAPVECRTLGTVIFFDPAEGRRIVAPKGDAVYAEISRHIHVREYTDAVAQARRELAEASGERADEARVKLARIAVEASKWGVKAVVPPAPDVQHQAATALLDRGTQPAAGYSDPQSVGDMPAPPPAAPVAMLDGPTPWPGMPIIFIPNTGEMWSGMKEVPGVCAKLQDDGRLSVVLFVEGAEVQSRDNLYRRGPDGNGHFHKSNVWDYNPHWLAEQERIRELGDQVAALSEPGKRRNHDGGAEAAGEGTEQAGQEERIRDLEEKVALLGELIAERRRWQARNERDDAGGADAAGDSAPPASVRTLPHPSARHSRRPATGRRRRGEGTPPDLVA
jgi:hypothetical protein